ncbi:hypothetical protein Q9251_17500 [Alkalihalobacillus macyae]|uniref:hypothetical protein n=1 Tax=Guptibacillus hwajinpoensis TaxID=208199 RepID=UPI00273B2654|nr:hypothetical protein [Alkalihalobacillus macyae]MDP4552678.1 hypothetical protein [Alkalihalobacillus macyae]
MRLINIAYEHLEKERSNSPEDSFVRSSVTYEEAGIQKTFYVLYPGIFATRAREEGVWTADSPVDEVVALNLLKRYTGRKRLYISEESEYLLALKEADLSNLLDIVQQIKVNGSYHL